MDKKKRAAAIFGCAALVFLAGALCTGGGEKHESIQEVMRDAVLHETARSVFLAESGQPRADFRIYCHRHPAAGRSAGAGVGYPRFQYKPGRFQLLLEQAVGMFDGLAKSNSPHRNRFLGAYVFAAGVYIFVGTIFEMFGVQAVTTAGTPISLPAPLSDINGAIALGCLSYGVILSGGIAGKRSEGRGYDLKTSRCPFP